MPLALVATACGGSGEQVPAEVAALFDIENNAIADLTSDGEGVPRSAFIESVLRAQEEGTAMRIAVAPPDGDFISAKAIVDQYGGTALSYQLDGTAFEGASRDMTAEQLDRAVDAAKLHPELAASAEAFVDAIAAEGLDRAEPTFSRNTLLALLVLAAAFMLMSAWSYLKARQRRDRRERREREFVERKALLTDWASQLRPELESLRSPVAASPDAAAQTTWHQVHDFVNSVRGTLEAANSQGELDMAEMRIGRMAIKLRDLRRSLGA